MFSVGTHTILSSVSSIRVRCAIAITCEIRDVVVDAGKLPRHGRPYKIFFKKKTQMFGLEGGIWGDDRFLFIALALQTGSVFLLLTLELLQK